jgi:hypothetical protein
MSTFRVVVYKPASSPIHLDVEVGVLASEAIRNALQSPGPHNIQGSTEEGTLEGWNLRARRHVEEGHWWSEDDINAYSDRKSGILFSGQADCQLY